MSTAILNGKRCYKISAEIVAEIKTAHSLLSLGQDGKIKPEQFEHLMEILGFPLKNDELDWVKRKVLPRKTLDFDGFLDIIIMKFGGVMMFKVHQEKENLTNYEMQMMMKNEIDVSLFIDRGSGLMLVPMEQFFSDYWD